MVNVAIKGKTYPSVPPYLGGREKIREFARAISSKSALHTSVEAAREAGYPDVVAPPTFPIVIQDATLRQLLDDEQAQVDFDRVVHGEQQFQYTRPIIAGDELRATLTITQVRQAGGHSMVTASSEIVDAADKHVVTAISTLVVRGA